MVLNLASLFNIPVLLHFSASSKAQQTTVGHGLATVQKWCAAVCMSQQGNVGARIRPLNKHEEASLCGLVCCAAQ